MAEVLNLKYDGGAGGTSLWLDGNSDYISAPDSTDWDLGTGDFTVEGWVRMDTKKSCTFVALGNNYPGVQVYVGTTDAGAAFYSRINGANKVYTSYSFPIGRWFHYAFVRESGTCIAYINGKDIGSHSADTANITGSTGGVQVGRGDGADYLHGHTREVRISNTARYSANFQVPSVPFSNDGNTKLLLHLDEAVGATAWTDSSSSAHTISGAGTAVQKYTVPGWTSASWLTDSSPSAHIVTPVADAKQLASVYNSTAGFFDGDSDYITIPDSADWDFGTGDFTLEGWMRTPTPNLYGVLVDVGGFGAGVRAAYYHATGNLNVILVNTAYNFAWLPADHNAWYHWAVCRDGNNMRVFINGVQIGSTADVTGKNINSLTAGVGIGRGVTSESTANYYFNGYQKEVRVSNTNRGYTTTFTPPTEPFTSDANTKLLLHMDSAGTMPIGSSAYTTAIGGYLSIPDSSEWDISGDYTAEAWIKPADVSDVWVIGNQNYSGATGGGWCFFIGGSANTNLVVMVQNVIKIQVTAANHGITVANVWYHIAWSKSGTSNKIFVNGKEVGSFTDNTATSSSNLMQIGRQPVHVNYKYYTGAMKNIRVSNSARYTTDFTPPREDLTDDANTLLLLPFNGVPGDTDNTNGWLTDGTGTHTVTSYSNIECRYTTYFSDRIFIDDGNTGHICQTIGTAKIDWLSANGIGAADFDGTGDYLSVPTSSDWAFGAGQFTVECWARWAVVGSTGLVSTGDSTGWAMSYATSALRAYIESGTTTLASSSFTPTVGEWYVLAMTRDATTLRLFINGKEVGSGANSTTITPAQDLNIGRDPVSTTWEMDGVMDLVSIDKGTALYTTDYIPTVPSISSSGLAFQAIMF